MNSRINTLTDIMTTGMAALLRRPIVYLWIACDVLLSCFKNYARHYAGTNSVS